MIKWTFCRERMPIPDDEMNPIYIVTVNHPNPKIERKIMFLRYGFNENRFKTPKWYYEDDEICYMDVICWSYWKTSKLPEPCLKNPKGFGSFMVAYKTEYNTIEMEMVFTKEEAIDLVNKLRNWYDYVVPFTNIKRKKQKDITWNYIKNNRIDC